MTTGLGLVLVQMRPTILLMLREMPGFNEYIYHNGDADTYIQFDTDEINFVVGAAHMIYLNEGGAGAQADKVTINNNLADVDFQVKGDNDANLFRTDAANDRVGIGTDAPVYTLHIAGTVGIDSYIYHNGDSDTYLKFDTNEVNLVAGNWSALKLDKTTGKIQLNNTNADLDLQVMADDGEVILHTDAGTNRVGIGTNAPNARLEVHSDGSIAQGAEIRLQHANNNTTDVVSTINFANSIGSVAMIQAGTTLANNNGYISFFTDNAGTSSEKIRLISDGNVGIGTTAPAGLLHLRVSSGALNTYYDGDGDKILWFRTASGTAQSEWKVDAAKTWITTRGTLPLKFGTNDTLALTIDGSTQAATFSANLLISRTNPTLSLTHTITNRTSTIQGNNGGLTFNTATSDQTGR